MKTIKIKYLRDIEPVQIFSIGDWIDLRAGVEIQLIKGYFSLIPLGVAMELPEGYEAIIAPRSSAFIKYGIIVANSIGIIDNSYCGDGDEWHLPVYPTRNVTIHKNDRICQFRIFSHQPPIMFKEVEILGNKNRNGFGSTGRK